MLRASAKGNNGPLIVAGLSEGNIGRLKAKQPIKASLRSFGVDQPGDLLIFYAPTEADMEREFRECGLIGEETKTTTNAKLDQESEIRSRYPHILIATVGLPRSGKSTWSLEQTWPIVNPDSIRLALHGQRFYGPAEPFVWATAKLMVRSLFQAGHQHVILDATNMTRKRRDEWQSREWGLFFKHIPTSAQVCMRRAEEEKDAEILPIIGRMSNEFEPLAADEQLWT